jgi:hypothetical protein
MVGHQVTTHGERHKRNAFVVMPAELEWSRRKESAGYENRRSWVLTAFNLRLITDDPWVS